MKSFYFLLGCCLLSPTLAGAGNAGAVSVRQFPPHLSTVQRDNTNAPTMRRVLNEDKEKGVGMWAVTAQDYNREPGFVHFYTGNTYNLEKTGQIKTYEEDPQLYNRWVMTGGTMHNGEYLGYVYVAFDLGYNYAKAFAKVDLEAGTWETLTDMSELEDDWNYMEAMTTEPKTGKLIGLARNTDGTVTTTIGEVNPATGEYTQLTALSEYYFTIEYDTDGTLWAVRWSYDPNDPSGTVTGSQLVTLDPDNGYAETKVADITKDGNAFIMNYQNTMRFETATGDLYILATNNSGTQYVCKLDTGTGVLTSYGTFGWQDAGTGLYIPSYTADDPAAPAQVSNLTSSFDDAQKVTLMWKNPTTSWNKEALQSITSVKIFRDGLEDSNLAATLTQNVAIGAEMTWKDENATDGVHTYYVVACNSKGDGVPDSWRAFTGRDVPGMPAPAYASKNGTGISLTWSAPTSGAHDGWFDKDNVSYKIVRYPDNVTVAQNVTGTSYNDYNLGEIRSYHYDIIPVTGDGEGTKATTDAVLAGTSVAVPWETEFASEEEAAMWTSADNNRDGRSFAYNSYNTGMQLYVESAGNSDDYAISPAIKMEGGTTYRATFDVYFQNRTDDYYTNNHSFNFTAGNDATAEAQSEVLLTKEGFQNYNYYETFTFEALFTPKADGDYNMAFHYNSPQGVNDVVVLKRFAVEKVYGKDLAAVKFDGTANPAKGAESDYTVTVKNAGKDVAESYKVQIVRLDGNNKVVLGETEVSESLESQAETEITVKATPDIEGEFQMAALTILAGDENADNDMSAAKTVTAAPEGTVPFNLVVDGENPAQGTRYPISFSTYYSIGQSIYHADELQLAGKKAEISRLAIEYDTNNPVNSFSMEIYLGLTDKANVGYDTTDWTPLSEQTKVYEGNQAIVEGEGNMLVFNFSEPFAYDSDKNLVITFLKEGDSDYSYPAVFKYFHSDWNATDDFRSILQESNNSPEYSSGGTWPYLPVLHLAVVTEDKPGGVTDIVIGGNYISFRNGTITFDGIDAARLTVYDLTGRTVLDQSIAEGRTSVNADFVSGVYAVKAETRDGNIYTQKIRVNK